jgi:hypothetical protein
MITANLQLWWIKFRQNILNRQSKRQGYQLTKIDLVREHSISLLQNRYGFSREQAISEFSKHYSKAQLY